MPLIKCPECGKEISTEAASCPHCGYPLRKEEEPSKPAGYPAPKPSDWTKEWGKKAALAKIGLAAITLLAAVPLILGIVLGNKISLFAGGIACAFFLIVFIASLFTVHPRTRVVDGYTILVYSGLFKNCLVVEGEVQGSGVTTRYFNGNLPNGKSVRAGISVWDGASKIDVGEEKTF